MIPISVPTIANFFFTHLYQKEKDDMIFVE